MTIRDMLRAFLLTDTTIATTFGTRIYPIKAPQGATYPLMVITKVDRVESGSLADVTTWVTERFQIDIWVQSGLGGSAASQAEVLGGYVRALLSEQANVFWTDTSVSPNVSIVVQVTAAGETEPFEEDVTDGFYRHSTDWFIGHQTAGGQY